MDRGPGGEALHGGLISEEGRMRFMKLLVAGGGELERTG